MYRIMIAKSKRGNYESLYQFLTTTTDGVTTPLEIDTKAKLDEKIEKMLNDDGYSKSDFIVVEVVDYSIDAKNNTDETAAQEGNGDSGNENVGTGENNNGTTE